MGTLLLYITKKDNEPYPPKFETIRFSAEQIQELEDRLAHADAQDILMKNHDIELKQYHSLRNNFRVLTKHILGLDYYNMGMDVYTSDYLTCKDIHDAYLGIRHKFWWIKLKDFLNRILRRKMK